MMQERTRKERKLFSLKHMCRGAGKIYAVIEPVAEVSGMRLAVRSRTAAGDGLPAKVIDWRQGNCRVLVLPIVNVTQVCTIEALGDGGEVIASEEHAVNRHVARAHSVVNTLRKDPAIRQIRDCDDRRGGNWCEVSVDRLITGGSREGLVVHGRIAFVGMSAADVQGDFDLRILGPSGTDIALAPCVRMRDETGRSPAYSDAVMREVQFSVRVDADADSLTAWVVPRNGNMPQGFRTLDTFGFSYLVGEWRKTTTTASAAPDYDRWYRTAHAVGTAEVALQAKTAFEIEPVFSIIVPLYRTPPAFFKEMVDSVLRQSYPKFELVLVNSEPGDERISGLIDEYRAADRRVVRVDLDENRGITENTNAGIAAATGDFLCFLDHDDVITDDALFCYARALNEYPETDMLYSDEDFIDATGREYSGPFFKPDWEPDLLLGMNYICHFLCVRKSIVDELDPPTREYDGAQDHHLALRVSERARNIYHERRILYHWRIHEQSTASGIDAKPYALEAGLRAVQSHLDRCGIKGKAVHPERVPWRYEVVYELEETPLVSIIIPTKDNVEMLDRCLRSIVDKTTYGNFEVILVENNSTEPETFEYYGNVADIDGRIRVVTFDGAFNYSAVNNFGATFAQGEYLLLLNNDTEVITGEWLERMLGLCMREGTGAVGAKLLYPDGTIQHCGVVSAPGGPCHMNLYRDYGDCGYMENTLVRQDIAAVTGACLMTSKELYDRLGGLDEQFAVCYNDVDYCYAVRDAGLLVVIDPGVELYHYESISRGFDVADDKKIRATRERALLMAKWPRRFSVPDESSNPNLLQPSIYGQAAF